MSAGTPHLPTVGTATVASGAGRRVLLVDDHIDTCLGMERLLKRRGYRVAVAHSVAEALTRAKEDEAFDLLISDLGLPDGTGFDIMQEIRRRGGPPGIALSGFGMESDIGKSREAGFSEHLIKPVSIDRLDAAMRKLLAPESASTRSSSPITSVGVSRWPESSFMRSKASGSFRHIDLFVVVAFGVEIFDRFHAPRAARLDVENPRRSRHRLVRPA